MTTMEIEKRLAAVEQGLARMKQEHSARHSPAANKDWVFKIWGNFANDPLFDEAMRLGRKWRDSQRPRRESKSKSRTSRRK